MYLTSKLNIISLFLRKRKNIANWTFGEDGEGPWQQMLKLSILDSTKKHHQCKSITKCIRSTINAQVLIELALIAQAGQGLCFILSDIRSEKGKLSKVYT